MYNHHSCNKENNHTPDELSLTKAGPPFSWVIGVPVSRYSQPPLLDDLLYLLTSFRWMVCTYQRYSFTPVVHLPNHDPTRPYHQPSFRLPPLPYKQPLLPGVNPQTPYCHSFTIQSFDSIRINVETNFWNVLVTKVRSRTHVLDPRTGKLFFPK